jgi:hypothetical protein
LQSAWKPPSDPPITITVSAQVIDIFKSSLCAFQSSHGWWKLYNGDRLSGERVKTDTARRR